jgi:HlyD family secretion protein
VTIGLGDGALTEVQGNGLQEGVSVVVGEEQKEAKGPASTNPFTPQLFRGSGKGQRQ